MKTLLLTFSILFFHIHYVFGSCEGQSCYPSSALPNPGNVTDVEKIFTEKTSEEIDKIAKEKGLWGLARKVKIVKIGNSLAVRIPKIISEFLGLKEGKEALMKPEKNRIVIEN